MGRILPPARTSENPGIKSLQLTIFAAAPVEAGGGCLPFFKLGLTGDTQANARDCLAAGFRNSRLALLAMRQAFTVGQPAPGQFDRVFYTGIYLILHPAITRPTNRHNELLSIKLQKFQFKRILPLYIF
jgi:hypothetical protein